MTYDNLSPGIYIFRIVSTTINKEERDVVRRKVHIGKNNLYVVNLIALDVKSHCKPILFGVCGTKEEGKLNCSSTRHFSNNYKSIFLRNYYVESFHIIII